MSTVTPFISGAGGVLSDWPQPTAVSRVTATTPSIRLMVLIVAFVGCGVD